MHHHEAMWCHTGRLSLHRQWGRLLQVCTWRAVHLARASLRADSVGGFVGCAEEGCGEDGIGVVECMVWQYRLNSVPGAL